MELVYSESVRKRTAGRTLFAFEYMSRGKKLCAAERATVQPSCSNGEEHAAFAVILLTETAWGAVGPGVSRRAFMVSGVFKLFLPLQPFVILHINPSAYIHCILLA